MASLPSNTFICNYNARDYVASTKTFPRTAGQSLAKDIVLKGTPTAHTEDGYVTFNGGQYETLDFNSAAENPFNRYNTATGRSLTIVYKTSSFSDNLFANRGYRSGSTGDYYNYMVRNTMFHTSSSGFLSMTPNSSPYIAYVRVNADGTCERKCVTTGQIVSASSISYGNAPSSCAFFRGFGGSSLGETYSGNFYWLYVSTEALTDEEIQKVIAYNENTSTFETDITAITASYNSTTSSVTLTAEEDMAWTASTSNDWITLSTTGGTGSSVFTVNVAANKAYMARNGLVTLTNGEDVIEITVEQAKYPLLIPNENIYRADLEVIKGYRSGSTINKAYRSGELIYYKLNYPEPTPPDYRNMPLTFKVISGGTISWMAAYADYTKEIQYSVNDGPWVPITSTTAGTPISLNSGDVVQFRGDNATYSSGSSYYNTFSGSTAKFEAEGNIMSLIDSTGFTTATTLTSSRTFLNLFRNCTGLTSAENLVLPATTLADYCYNGMFQGCLSLKTAPELPATTLANNCYQNMFYGCTSLITIPTNYLPARTLTQRCYGDMFHNCSSLTAAPELPATTLSSSCYRSMFDGCTSLTSAPAILPATIITPTYCYQYMFRGCSSLTTAPELPATTLSSGCYYQMFNGCTNLNYIKCLATDISASNCTIGWVMNVAATGTFVTPSSTNWTTDTSGIPSGWTRVNA